VDHIIASAPQHHVVTRILVHYVLERNDLSPEIRQSSMVIHWDAIRSTLERVLPSLKATLHHSVANSGLFEDLVATIVAIQIRGQDDTTSCFLESLVVNPLEMAKAVFCGGPTVFQAPTQCGKTKVLALMICVTSFLMRKPCYVVVGAFINSIQQMTGVNGKLSGPLRDVLGKEVSVEFMDTNRTSSASFENDVRCGKLVKVAHWGRMNDITTEIQRLQLQDVVLLLDEADDLVSKSGIRTLVENPGIHCHVGITATSTGWIDFLDRTGIRVSNFISEDLDRMHIIGYKSLDNISILTDRSGREMHIPEDATKTTFSVKNMYGIRSPGVARLAALFNAASSSRMMLLSLCANVNGKGGLREQAGYVARELCPGSTVLLMDGTGISEWSRESKELVHCRKKTSPGREYDLRRILQGISPETPVVLLAYFTAMRGVSLSTDTRWLTHCAMLHGKTMSDGDRLQAIGRLTGAGQQGRPDAILYCQKQELDRVQALPGFERSVLQAQCSMQPLEGSEDLVATKNLPLAQSNVRLSKTVGPLGVYMPKVNRAILVKKQADDAAAAATAADGPPLRPFKKHKVSYTEPEEKDKLSGLTSRTMVLLAIFDAVKGDITKKISQWRAADDKPWKAYGCQSTWKAILHNREPIRQLKMAELLSGEHGMVQLTATGLKYISSVISDLPQ
jgi:hypothetical protein